MLFEMHLKPDLAFNREMIGKSNEIEVLRGVNVNIYGIIRRASNCTRGGFEISF